MISGGLGGGCYPGEVGTFVSLSYEAVKSIDHAYYIEFIAKQKNGKYIVNSQVSTQSTEVPGSASVGDSLCDLDYGRSLSISDVQKNDSTRGPVQATEADIIIPKNGNDFSGYATIAEAAAAYQGPVFEKAKSILLSTRIE